MSQILRKVSIFDSKFIFIALITLISVKLWSFRGIPDSIYDGLEFVILIALFVVVFLYNRKDDNTEKLFKHNVQLFIWIPIISSFGALVFHEQSLTLSFLILRTNFFWLLYFVLHIFNVPVKRVIQLIIFVGLVWIFITIAQQFTYPIYYFYNRTEEANYDFYRAGVYRFMIDQHQYGLFVVVFFYHKFLVSKKSQNLIVVLIGLVGYYYYSGRQYALAAVACLVIASLLQKGAIKVYATTIIAAIVIVLLVFKDTLFGDYIEMTNEQLESDDDVRILAANFFLFDYWPHWITTVIGNGYENYKSDYGKEMLYINEVRLLFRSDVGIIGVFNMFGIFYVLNILWLNLKGLKSKFFGSNSSYLKLIFFNALLLLPLSEAYSVPSGAVPFFCLIFYLVDKAYEDQQRKIAEVEANHSEYKLITA